MAGFYLVVKFFSRFWQERHCRYLVFELGRKSRNFGNLDPFVQQKSGAKYPHRFLETNLLASPIAFTVLRGRGPSFSGQLPVAKHPPSSFP